MNEHETAALIERHNHKYWVENASEISDAEYDKLVEQLRGLNPAHPLLSKAEKAIAGSKPVRHSKPMLSLDKVYSFNELMSWIKKVSRSNDEKFFIQPKYDGIAADWSGSILSTRGDGETGQDISSKIPLIRLEESGVAMPIPLIACKRPLRGEIVIKSDDFKNVYSHVLGRNGKPYRNPREAVAGIMSTEDTKGILNANLFLTLVEYDNLSLCESARTIEWNWGCIASAILQLPYPMDGIVVKLADQAYADSLGNTAHHPLGQMAFKFKF